MAGAGLTIGGISVPQASFAARTWKVDGSRSMLTQLRSLGHRRRKTFDQTCGNVETGQIRPGISQIWAEFDRMRAKHGKKCRNSARLALVWVESRLPQQLFQHVVRVCFPRALPRFGGATGACNPSRHRLEALLRTRGLLDTGLHSGGRRRGMPHRARRFGPMPLCIDYCSAVIFHQ